MDVNSVELENGKTGIDRTKILIAEAEATAIRARADAIIAEAMAILAEAEVVKAEAEVAKTEAETAKAEAEALKAEADAAKAEIKISMSTSATINEKPPATERTPHKSVQTLHGVQETVHASQVVGSVPICTMMKGDKIPKERIVLWHDEYQALGITNFRATAIKNDGYGGVAVFAINGEYSAKTNEQLLIVLMVFNSFNEMIGAGFDERIEEGEKKRKTYSTNVTVPDNEQISRIEVRIIKDPLGWD